MKRRWQVVHCGSTEQMVVSPTLARWDSVRTGCTHTGQRGANAPGGLQALFKKTRMQRYQQKTKVWQC